MNWLRQRLAAWLFPAIYRELLMRRVDEKLRETELNLARLR